MSTAFVLSLICGPVGVTLGCWLFSAIFAARSRNEGFVRVLVDKRTRSSSRSLPPRRD